MPLFTRWYSALPDAEKVKISQAYRNIVQSGNAGRSNHRIANSVIAERIGDLAYHGVAFRFSPLRDDLPDEVFRGWLNGGFTSKGGGDVLPLLVTHDARAVGAYEAYEKRAAAAEREAYETGMAMQAAAAPTLSSYHVDPNVLDPKKAEREAQGERDAALAAARKEELLRERREREERKERERKERREEEETRRAIEEMRRLEEEVRARREEERREEERREEEERKKEDLRAWREKEERRKKEEEDRAWREVERRKEEIRARREEEDMDRTVREMGAAGGRPPPPPASTGAQMLSYLRTALQHLTPRSRDPEIEAHVEGWLDAVGQGAVPGTPSTVAGRRTTRPATPEPEPEERPAPPEPAPAPGEHPEPPEPAPEEGDPSSPPPPRRYDLGDYLERIARPINTRRTLTAPRQPPVKKPPPRRPPSPEGERRGRLHALSGKVPPLVLTHERLFGTGRT